jgi:hypothetical protein
MIGCAVASAGFQLFYLTTVLPNSHWSGIEYLYILSYAILALIAAASIMKSDRPVAFFVLIIQALLVYYRYTLIYGLNVSGDMVPEMYAVQYTALHGWTGPHPEVTSSLPAPGSYFNAVTDNLTFTMISMIASISSVQTLSFIAPAVLMLIPLLTFIIFRKFGFIVGALAAELLLIDYSTLTMGQGVLRDHVTVIIFLVIISFFLLKGFVKTSVENKSFVAVFLLTMTAFAMSHIFNLLLFSILLASLVIARVPAKFLQLISASLLVFIVWHVFADYYLLTTVYGHLTGFMQLIQGTALNAKYSIGVVFSPTGSIMQTVVNTAYRAAIVLGCIGILVWHRKNRSRLVIGALTFAGLLIVALAVVSPNASLMIAEPYRTYDLFLPFLSGAAAFFLFELFQKFGKHRLRQLRTTGVVISVVVFSVATLSSLTPYMYVPWNNLSFNQQVITYPQTQGQLQSRSLESYLSSYATQPLVIESDQSGRVSIFGYPWPTLPIGTTVVTLGSGGPGAITVLNNFALNGYLVWSNALPLPMNATILYSRPVNSVIEVPSDSLNEIYFSDIAYNTGNLSIFKSP